MARTVALDTCAIVFLLAQEPPDDDPDHARWVNVHENFRRLRSEGASFIIPVPVLTELSVDGATGAELSRELSALGGSTRFEPLEAFAAERAGQMLGPVMAGRGASDRRSAVKFDALIAGVAVAAGVDAIFTTDTKDYRRFLAVIGSGIEVIQGDEVHGQQVIALAGTLPLRKPTP